MLFDDDSNDEFQLLAVTVIEEEEEMVNEGRTSQRRGSISGHAVIQRDRVAGKKNNRVPKSLHGTSYAKVAKGVDTVVNSKGTMEEEIMEVMKWDEKSSDDSWLKCCAVGVLKKFADVQSVIKGLLDNNIQSSSYYLGDKNILWVFNTTKERDISIRNKFLWEDYFSSVGLWTNAITPRTRLSWLEFRGILLNCWCKEFFMRLGWAVGEPLVVEEETLNKLVLNRGRVLVLLPFGLKCPGSIKVVSGSRSFPVSVREDSTPINPAWISWRLGIDDIFVSDSSFPDHNEDRHGMNEGDRMVGGNVSVLKKGGEVALKTLINNSDAELDNLIQTNMDLARENDMGHYNHDVEDSLDRPITANEYPKSIISKGKGILSKKQSQKIVGPIVHNGKIVLDKRLEYGYERVGEGDDSDSSSNDDRIIGQTSHFPIMGEEPSIVSSSQLK
ncbi:hypothetical protein LWI29_000066 [Acer saccharum]|uniref:DUF4283 domain-containing protein n=1 Tax=Acer saccharum TaxID=4024 RepID=A0AA39TAA8_ACESA|nr:hypothetical protein LWI29_000066 [Acer saccharum]